MNTNIEGIKTEYFTDVKVDIRAGMQFGTNNYKIRKIGFDVFRLYFDTSDKDCQVGRERIKRQINKNKL